MIRIPFVHVSLGPVPFEPITGLQIPLFFGFSDLGDFLDFLIFVGHFLGPGGLPKGPGMDYASFGPSFSPN